MNNSHTKDLVLGIDPGAKGACAILSLNKEVVEVVPYKDEKRNELIDRIKIRAPRIKECIIELVHAMPEQGVSSTFKFGANYGFYLGMLETIGIPYIKMAPQVWQKRMCCLTRGKKMVTKMKAKQLFPNITITHAIADALIIAEYARVRNSAKTIDRLFFKM